MCEHFRKTSKRVVIGYKVVAKHKKTGKYYSFMTGNKYPSKDTDMPVWCSERKTLAPGFSRILPGDINKHRQLAKDNWKNYGWKKEQIGKTGAFVRMKMAYKYRDYVMPRFNGSSHDLIVVKVKLSKELVKADLSCEIVFCGKRIEILEEVC